MYQTKTPFCLNVFPDVFLLYSSLEMVSNGSSTILESCFFEQ